MFSKKILYTWIAASATMFSLSFIWHGVVLNDFLNLTYPKEIFSPLFSLLYLAIGLVFAVAIGYVEIIKNIYYKSLIFGSFGGFIIFLIAFLLGVSFNSEVKVTYIALDLIWQVFEQSAGGLVAGYVYLFIEQERRFLFPL